MPRNIPDPPNWDEPQKREEIKLTLKVVTPMFGGGYKAREVDPICVIRPAAIRGHLRFWWRATVGASFPTAEELFKNEKGIWGSTENPGAVRIVVDNISQGSKISLTPSGKQTNNTQEALLPEKVSSKKGPQEGYFLFPFQKQTDGTPEGVGHDAITFRLLIKFSDRWNEEKKQLEPLTQKEKDSVKKAVRAWIVFGGVGARTRRGCGALQVINSGATTWLPTSRDGVADWLKGLVSQESGTANHTHLKGASIIIGDVCTKEDNLSAPRLAWRELGTFWARFRKGHIPSVRDYQPTSNCDWQDYRLTLVKNYFPKNPPPGSLALAKPFFGLPIIYQKFNNAPYTKFTIEAAETGRMASPVILKPLIFANGSACPMVVVLSTPRPQKIAIDKNKVDLKVPTSDKVLKALKVSDPLQAVTKAAKEIWGSSSVIEVTL